MTQAAQAFAELVRPPWSNDSKRRCRRCPGWRRIVKERIECAESNIHSLALENWGSHWMRDPPRVIELEDRTASPGKGGPPRSMSVSRHLRRGLAALELGSAATRLPPESQDSDRQDRAAFSATTFEPHRPPMRVAPPEGEQSLLHIGLGAGVVPLGFVFVLLVGINDPTGTNPRWTLLPNRASTASAPPNCHTK